MNIANEISPKIIGVLKDLKKTIGITSEISHSISITKSQCLVTFGQWFIGDEVSIEIVTLEYDYDSELNGQLLLGIKTIESISINNRKQINKILSKVTVIKRSWPGCKLI